MNKGMLIFLATVGLASTSEGHRIEFLTTPGHVLELDAINAHVTIREVKDSDKIVVSGSQEDLEKFVFLQKALLDSHTLVIASQMYSVGPQMATVSVLNGAKIEPGAHISIGGISMTGMQMDVDFAGLFRVRAVTLPTITILVPSHIIIRFSQPDSSYKGKWIIFGSAEFVENLEILTRGLASETEFEIEKLPIPVGRPRLQPPLTIQDRTLLAEFRTYLIDTIEVENPLFGGVEAWLGTFMATNKRLTNQQKNLIAQVKTLLSEQPSVEEFSALIRSGV
jgi:hypothetical protein